MKLKHVFTALFGLMFFVFQACKKDAGKENTTTQKIQAKWQVDNVVSNDHTDGVDHKTTASGNSTDYVDFRSDGKTYSNFQGTMDTSTYTILNDSKIIIGGTDTAIIQNLTDHVFILYQKITTSSTDYSEETLNLKK